MTCFADIQGRSHHRIEAKDGSTLNFSTLRVANKKWSPPRLDTSTISASILSMWHRVGLTSSLSLFLPYYAEEVHNLRIAGLKIQLTFKSRNMIGDWGEMLNCFRDSRRSLTTLWGRADRSRPPQNQVTVTHSLRLWKPSHGDTFALISERTIRTSHRLHRFLFSFPSSNVVLHKNSRAGTVD